MRSFIASAALVAGVAAHGHLNSTVPVEYTTKHVTAYTTFCPAPTKIVDGSSTITVTEPATVTLCPTGCTVVQPVAPTTTPDAEVSPVQPTDVIPTSVSTTAEHLPSDVSDSPVSPIITGVPSASAVSPVSPVSPPIYVNSTGPGVPTAPVVSILPTGTAAPSGTGVSSPVPFEGAAPKMAASGASLVALLGLAVFFL
ncbi:MAG: hypothetical protein L6R35_006614 [Caloplaca aegaea]|nr:MAG: hypothetical protein L6R35_006614 [Caloplaca aegaea]